MPDSSLMTKRFGRISKLLLTASPEYVSKNSNPEKPSDLEKHNLIATQPLSTWTLQNSSEETFTLVPQARFSVNEYQLAVEAACAGLGILFCPLNICYTDLQEGRLINRV